MHKDIVATWSVILVGVGLDPSQMNSFYTQMLTVCKLQYSSIDCS